MFDYRVVCHGCRVSGPERGEHETAVLAWNELPRRSDCEDRFGEAHRTIQLEINLAEERKAEAADLVGQAYCAGRARGLELAVTLIERAAKGTG